MSDISLQIGGRTFRMACGPGEEAHLLKLGRIIDSKLSEMPAMAGQSEPRMLLYAALMLADEVHELRGSAPSHPALSPDALELLANKLEALALQLEEPLATS